MTEWTHEKIAESLARELGVSPGGPAGADLAGNGWAIVIAGTEEELTPELLARARGIPGKKNLRRLIACPPNAVIANRARELAQGTGVGVVEGHGTVLKAAATDIYRSVTLDPLGPVD
ncbi:MAG: hypothetical protein QGH59_07045 [Gemmatimonadota bacterium]|nr:hypothetical protein [Gemmatimonadota bacterium]